MLENFQQRMFKIEHKGTLNKFTWEEMIFGLQTHVNKFIIILENKFWHEKNAFACFYRLFPGNCLVFFANNFIII